MQLENSETVAVVTLLNRFQVITQSLSGVASIRFPPIVVKNGDNSCPPDIINFHDLIADRILELEKSGKKTGVNAAIDTALLLFSSGTTGGLPKAVEITHRYIV